MLTIDLLKNQTHQLPRLVEIWYEGIGKNWTPDINLDRVIAKLNTHLNEHSLPLTFVALEDNQAIGMGSLRINDGIRPELSPWLGGLVVDQNHQKKGIGELLIAAVKQKAKTMGFAKLFLFAFDPTIPEWYGRLGWQKISMDECLGHVVTVMEIDLII